MKKYVIVQLILSFFAFTSINAENFKELAQTPPMGWNSWNKFGCNINETLIKEIADAIVSSGMRDSGYEYIVIDDCWQIGRDTLGNIIVDESKFPSGIKHLADYIHNLDLKFGIYSCAGSLTCQGRPGSRGYQFQDARQYAEWGVDYLKYDWCYKEGQNAKAAYKTMSDALKATNRDIVFSICEWGENKPWLWAENIGHLWRVSNDIRDCFDCVFDWGGLGVLNIIDIMADLHQFAKPGQWNDADMLEVGNGGMTKAQYETHFSMWAMLASPLMAGNDIRNMDNETREILTNKEVIAINQDILGKQAVKYLDYGDYEVWVKPLANNEVAFCFLNRSNSVWELDYSWLRNTIYFENPINFHNNECEIRDVWKHKNIGTTNKSIKTKISPYSILMVHLKPIKTQTTINQ